LASKDQQLTSKNQELASKNQELASKDQELASKNQELASKDQELASKDQELASKDQELASKDQELASKDQELASKDQELASKDRKIVELQNEIEGGLAIPPPHKIFLVAGTENASWFLESGEMAARSIRETLENNGLDIENFDSILEFGCGVGRIIRHWNTLEGPAIYGTDYNPDLIAWCKRNLPFAQFQVNSLDDMFEYEDQKFDFIYAWSVFTHLPEPQQFYWIDELSRGLRSGGYLFITTHGEHYLQHYGEAYRQHLLSTDRDRLEFLTAEHGEDWYRQYNLFSEEQTEQFRNGHLVIFGEDVAGTNQCNAFHPETYVRETLAKGFAVVDFIPGGGKGSYQDAYLMRKM